MSKLQGAVYDRAYNGGTNSFTAPMTAATARSTV